MQTEMFSAHFINQRSPLEPSPFEDLPHTSNSAGGRRFIIFEVIRAIHNRGESSQHKRNRPLRPLRRLVRRIPQNTEMVKERPGLVLSHVDGCARVYHTVYGVESRSFQSGYFMA